jgi:CheY-like chemotaxis protein
LVPLTDGGRLGGDGFVRRLPPVSTQTGPTLWLKVADTGMGIAPELMDHLAQPFQLGDSSSTRPHDGVGVGLCIVRELVVLLGGALALASAALPRQGADRRGSVAGGGTAVLVALPCEALAMAARLPTPPDSPAPAAPLPKLVPTFPPVAMTPAPPPAVVPAPSTPTTGITAPAMFAPSAMAAPVAAPPPARRILVVDDNPVNVMVIQRQLSQCGYSNVVVATNGQECVDYMARVLRAADVAPHGVATGVATTTPHRRGTAAAASATTAAAPALPVDAIFMDLHMPVMDGLTATRAVRALEAEVGAPTLVPVVAVSSDDPRSIGDACRQVGMAAFVRKPVLLPDLVFVLNALFAPPASSAAAAPAGPPTHLT